MESFPTPKSVCPYCDHVLDTAGGGERAPEAGDLTICVYCTQPLVFDEHVRARKPNDGEIEATLAQDLGFEREFRQALRALKATDRREWGGDTVGKE